MRRRMLQGRPHMEQDGQCNRALVVSVAEFDPGVKLGRRPGAQRDAKRLHRTLSKLGFKVELHTDLSGEEIYQLFLTDTFYHPRSPEEPQNLRVPLEKQKLVKIQTIFCRTNTQSRRPVKDCFLAVLSSHGDEGFVFGADGERVRLSRIFSFFNNQLMEKKAKVFLVQACRGPDLDDGVEVDSADDVSDFSQDVWVPVDTAVMYAAAPGYGAFMHPLGSVFLQTFCSLLETEGNRELELTRLMTRLSHSVAYTFQAKGRSLGGKKEMPCLVTSLTREVFPFAEARKEGRAAGLSATSLVGSQAARKRTPSIS